MFEGIRNGLHAAGDLELGEDIADVKLDGGAADNEAIRNFAVV